MPLPQSIVVLGPVTFREREVPDKMPFGGKQAMAIHKNLGGQRVVDIMGPDPDPIKWSGLFFGTNASVRARIVDALKDSGAEIFLIWGTFSRKVVVSSFVAEYKHETEVHYEITVEVTEFPGTLNATELQQIIDKDWGAALATAGLPQSIKDAIAVAQGAIATVAAAQPNGSLNNASMTALAPAIKSVEAAYNVIDGIVQATEANVSGVSLDAGVGNSVLDGFKNFQTEASNAAVAANLRIARAYVGRIVGNLTTLGG